MSDNGQTNGRVTPGRLPPFPQEPLTGNALRQFEEIVANIMTLRSDAFNNLLDPRRDIDDECGYPNIATAIEANTYRQLYDREAVANRAVQVLPKESWQVSPLVYEDDAADISTPFEEAWDQLDHQLSGGASWYKDEHGSVIWEHLYRADVLSGIGHFGVILLGIDDGKPLEEPIDGVVTTNRRAVPIRNQAGRVVGARMGKLRRGKAIPDAPMTRDEETALLKLPNLTTNEKAVIQRWAHARELTENKVTKNPANPGQSIMAGLGKEVTGTDAQYSSGYGYLGNLPGGSMSGTDQQYFGVQFGPSEALDQTPAKKKHELLFMRTFDESLVQIVRYEWNIRNPRFGMPVMYRITLNDPREQHSGIGLPLATVFVHWSRVIHVADNRGSSEIFGVPRMQPILNRILDLRKLYSGSAEMYWRGAFPGLSLETHPQLGGDVNMDTAGNRDAMEQYFNGLQRYLQLMGMTAKTLAPTVVDPTPQILVQIQAICIQLGIPQRVFMGSERGELASTQDDSQWNDQLRHRQGFYITPRIIVPLIDRLIVAGVLPEPGKKGGAKKRLDAKPVPPKPPTENAFGKSNESSDDEKADDATDEQTPDATDTTDKAPDDEESDGYSVEWPDLESLSETDKATNANTIATALSTFASGGVADLIPFRNFATKVLDWDEEEVAEFEAAAEAEREKREADDAALAEQHGMIPEAPPGFQHPPPPPEPPGAVKLKPGEKLVNPPPPNKQQSKVAATAKAQAKAQPKGKGQSPQAEG